MDIEVSRIAGRGVGVGVNVEVSHLSEEEGGSRAAVSVGRVGGE
jgi:hypothetical protein